MIKYLACILLALQLSSVAFAHLCLFDPPQRQPNWGVPIGSGDNACYQVESNCGNTTAGSPVALYTAGSTIQVFFQQNYNHWYAPNPGFLDVGISYGGDNGNYIQLSQTISDFNAWDMVSQTNYTVSVTLPIQSCKSCVLRVRYVSNNAGEPYPDFYQCSDIALE
ncbi:hypothetical protein DICPUDRAFT_96564 [Dictyostelium purpureum]|uniref:Chitin-binding type-4 domain-containing protein n=1 Tax=Dictyostelium purpureum TaxID=5786 RepID=F0Z9G7_DICPU|nr:uncharacterized protein DICPUDRAFT_96564 [Dictyostelium purpureum]EGC39377.1 hypothetical protein DICPUDRAFT_96564 [Dictyostelium purpureum]|eukprot:XP_003284051.1 hypothetical protein DICPUDRAFT_96564 [Dictyostelium purpureum]